MWDKQFNSPALGNMTETWWTLVISYQILLTALFNKDTTFQSYYKTLQIPVHQISL